MRHRRFPLVLFCGFLPVSAARAQRLEARISCRIQYNLEGITYPGGVPNAVFSCITDHAHNPPSMDSGHRNVEARVYSNTSYSTFHSADQAGG